MVAEKGLDTALREICLWEILDDDEAADDQPAVDEDADMAPVIPPGKRD